MGRYRDGELHGRLAAPRVICRVYDTGQYSY
jgi:hypothetical protein